MGRSYNRRKLSCRGSSMSSRMAGIILVVEVLGAVAMAVGAGLIYLPAGIVLAGFLALVFAVAFERSRAQ